MVHKHKNIIQILVTSTSASKEKKRRVKTIKNKGTNKPIRNNKIIFLSFIYHDNT